MQSLIDITAISAASLALLVGLVWLILPTAHKSWNVYTLIARVDKLEAGLKVVEDNADESIQRIVALESNWQEIGDVLARIESAVTKDK